MIKYKAQLRLTRPEIEELQALAAVHGREIGVINNSLDYFCETLKCLDENSLAEIEKVHQEIMDNLTTEAL